MEANVYFFAALVSTGIFLLQFILSIFFGSMDTDIDVNADGNADIDLTVFLCPLSYIIVSPPAAISGWYSLITFSVSSRYFLS